MAKKDTLSIKMTAVTIQEIKNYIISGSPPCYLTKAGKKRFIDKFSDFTLSEDGFLLTPITETGKKLRAVANDDTEMINMIFKEIHAENNHLRLYKAWHEIRKKWFGFKKDHIISLIDQCAGCPKRKKRKKTKKPKEKEPETEEAAPSTIDCDAQDQARERTEQTAPKKGPAKKIPSVSKPMERLDISIIDLSANKESNNGYTHILHIIDAYSEYHFVRPLSDTFDLSVQIVQEINKLCEEEGYPAYIYTSRTLAGIDIESIMKNQNNDLSFKFIQGNTQNYPYEHNKHSETLFKTFKSRVRRYTMKSEDMRTWIKMINWLVQSLNKRKQSYTNITPSMIFKEQVHRVMVDVKELNTTKQYKQKKYREYIEEQAKKRMNCGYTSDKLIYHTNKEEPHSTPQFGDIVRIHGTNREIADRQKERSELSTWMVLEKCTDQEDHFLVGAGEVTQIVPLNQIEIVEKNIFTR